MFRVLSPIALFLAGGCSLGGVGQYFAQKPEMPVLAETIGGLEIVRPAAPAQPGLESGRRAKLSAVESSETLLSKAVKATAPTTRANSKNDIFDTNESPDYPREHTEFGDSSTPFQMEVAQKFYDGQALTLRVHLSTKTAVAPADIAIEAVGLKDGQVLTRDIRFLDELVVTEVIEKGKKLAIALSLNNPEISEFQVRGMWGEDAHAKREELAAHQPPLPTELAESLANDSQDFDNLVTNTGHQGDATTQYSRSQAHDDASASWQASKHPSLLPDPPTGLEPKLEMEVMRVDRKSTDCPHKACPQVVTLFGVLKNVGDAAVTDVELAAGLFWQEGRKTPRFPENNSALIANERVVKLPTHILLPGEEKRIRLNIDRLVPQIPGGQFVPHARILSSRNLGAVN